MAWEGLEEELADEFSDNRRLGWVDGGYRFFRVSPCPFVRPERARSRRRWLKHTEWKRGWRARRRARLLREGLLPARCQRPGCCNLLAPWRSAKRRFCSGECKDWRPGKPPAVRQCAAPGCPNTFLSHGRRETCSNRCRQRAWLYRRAGTAGGGAAGGTGAQE